VTAMYATVQLPGAAPQLPTKDFSDTRPPPQFTVDDELFVGVTNIPAVEALTLSDKLALFDSDIDSHERLRVITEVVRVLLESNSADRLIERLSNRDRPIGLTQLIRITYWLLERYYHGESTHVADDEQLDDDDEDVGSS